MSSRNSLRTARPSGSARKPSPLAALWSAMNQMLDRVIALEACELEHQSRHAEARALRAQLRADMLAAGVDPVPALPAIARGRGIVHAAAKWIDDAKKFIESDETREAGLGLAASIIVDKLGDEVTPEMAFDAVSLYAQEARLPLRSARSALGADVRRLRALYDAAHNDVGELGEWLDQFAGELDGLDEIDLQDAERVVEQPRAAKARAQLMMLARGSWQ